MKYFASISNKEQLKRWTEALRVLENLPAHVRKKHWDMSSWGYDTPCGTVACAAGHIGLYPWFRRQGFKLTLRKRFIKISPDELSDFVNDQCGSESYFGKTGAKVEVITTDISDPYDFFGDGAAIFNNPETRSVVQVIKEVKAHIKQLQNIHAQEVAA